MTDDEVRQFCQIPDERLARWLRDTADNSDRAEELRYSTGVSTIPLRAAAMYIERLEAAVSVPHSDHTNEPEEQQ